MRSPVSQQTTVSGVDSMKRILSALTTNVWPFRQGQQITGRLLR
jgi:hypothetical protein